MLQRLKNLQFPKVKIVRGPEKTLDLSFGEQDQLDLISYEGLEENGTYLKLGDSYIRTLFISGYPYIASSGWLSGVVNFNQNVDISFHFEEIDASLALPQLMRKITELESTRRTMERQGRFIGSEITDPLNSAISLKEKIQRGQQKLFQVSIYVLLHASSLEELNKMTKILHSLLATKLFFSKTASFQQIEGLQSVLPRGENLLNQKRNLDSASAALTFPFVSSEFVQESGILYGINKANNSLVIIDRFSLTNANSIIFAQSGSGKSYTAKTEILRQLMQQTEVIVIDPEREYKQLCESVNATYITISANSEHKINPFDFNGMTTLSEHMQDLTELLSLLFGGLTTQEKAVVDKAVLQTYKIFGWTKTKKGTKYPLLKDFYKTLKSLKEKDLATRLEKYVTGSLSTLFDEQTNIQLNNRLVVFDIKDLSDSLRPIMMLVIANYVQNVVKKHPKRRLLVIDEGWKLLEHKESARFITDLVRRGRKYYLGVNIITQQANDFLNNEYGKAIASQSSLRILMKQDTTTIKKVVSEFGLSEYERQFLLTCDKGEAIIIADQNHIAVSIVTSEEEYPLLTTDPKEVFANNA